jgi:methoxymalonate biosynthesis acyl carrier protein
VVNDVVTNLESFIRAHFRVKSDDAYFNVDVNLWEEGYVDSTGAIEMIAHLESTYGIALSQEVLFDPDFTTVRGIGRLVVRTLEQRMGHTNDLLSRKTG